MRHTAFCKYQSKDMLLLGLVVFGCVVLACVCTADLECQYFEPNTYCFVDTKYLCPAHSSSPAGSDDVSDCLCNEGCATKGTTLIFASSRTRDLFCVVRRPARPARIPKNSLLLQDSDHIRVYV